jgi:ABC-type Na+ efflux pump permease subunit
MMHCLKPIIANKRGVSAKPKRATHLRNKKTRKKSTASVSKLRLIATVIIVILFSLGLYALNQLESEKIARTNKPVTNSVIIEEKSLPNAEDDYTFYSRLKDFEVVVNKEAAYSSSRSAEDNYIYLIQAGSFKTKAQAEKLLVELTLLGLEPKINSAKNASGNLWYRVRLGPFTTRGGMTAARSTIISNNLEAMVMKRKI